MVVNGQRILVCRIVFVRMCAWVQMLACVCAVTVFMKSKERINRTDLPGSLCSFFLLVYWIGEWHHRIFNTCFLFRVCLWQIELIWLYSYINKRNTTHNTCTAQWHVTLAFLLYLIACVARDYSLLYRCVCVSLYLIIMLLWP